METDIKDASNRANGGSCAQLRALMAVQPRLHYARLAAGQPVQRQHGAALQLALEAALKLSLHELQTS